MGSGEQKKKASIITLRGLRVAAKGVPCPVESGQVGRANREAAWALISEAIHRLSRRLFLFVLACFHRRPGRPRRVAEGFWRTDSPDFGIFAGERTPGTRLESPLFSE
jgi:hypothetical protein